MKGYRRPPHCSFCFQAGHNRTSCASLKTTKLQIIEKYILLRAKYWEAVKNLPLGKGALIRFVEGEYFYDQNRMWKKIEDGEEEIQIVMNIYLPSNINENGELNIVPFGSIDETDYVNARRLPVVDGYVTKYWKFNRRYNKYKYWWDYDYKEFAEKHLICAGATLDETVDRDNLQKWLAAEDIKSSHIFDIRGKDKASMFEHFGMDTEIVG